jgi:hypothetical protein
MTMRLGSVRPFKVNGLKSSKVDTVVDFSGDFLAARLLSKYSNNVEGAVKMSKIGRAIVLVERRIKTQRRIDNVS